MCHFKRTCPSKPADSACTTGWAPPPQSETAPTFQVGRGWFEIDGYKCGGSKSTVLFYPKPTADTDGPFPVVVYGHGAWGEVDGSDDWLATVASLGLIVIAPFAGKDTNPCGAKFADDLVLALNATRAGGATLHPALATASWENTGLFGHSKGAKYVPLAASRAGGDLNVRAFVSSCDVPSKHYHVHVPAMFTTGTLDKYNVGDEVKKYFEAYSASRKVYANLKDAYHMEVQEGMRLNVLTGQFLSCHVVGKQADCDVVYGTGENSLCEVNEYADQDGCIVVSQPSVVLA